MSSKHLRGDINYAWPTAEVAGMGAKVNNSLYIMYTYENVETNFKNQKFSSVPLIWEFTESEYLIFVGSCANYFPW